MDVQTISRVNRMSHLERLELMVSEEGGQLWVFSDKDLHAIEFALAEIDRLETELRKATR